MRIFMMMVFIFSSLTLGQSAQAQQPNNEVLKKDFSLFLGWFPGRYDNSLQTFWEPDLKIPEEDRHNRIHSIFKAVDLPDFGKNVFYVEQYEDGDPTRIYRQRIYSFSIDEKENAIRLKIYTPKNSERLIGAYKDINRLKQLRMRDTTTIESCDVFWKKNANQFIGYMKEGACRISSKRLGKDILIHDDLVLTENEIWIADRAETVDGDYVFGNKAGVAHKLRKIRPFDCWVSVLPGVKHGDSGKDNNDWQFSSGGWLHDQGGILTIETDEETPREIRVRLRRVEWPTGTNRPSLVMYIEEGKDTRAISYTWTEYDGERIGINLRWLQTSCSHKPERLYEDGR